MARALAAVALLTVGGVLGYSVARFGASAERRADTPLMRVTPQRIAALGRLEPVTGIVAVYGPPGDRIARLHPLAPGQQLEAGQIIAELASAEERRRQLTIAELELQEVRHRRQMAEQAGLARIRAAEADWQQTLAQQADDLAALDARLEFLAEQQRLAEAQLARLEKLRRDKVPVAAEEYDKARLAVAQATAERKAAEALRRKTLQSYQHADKVGQARRAAAEAELQQALAQFPLDSAQARYDLAHWQLQHHATIRAPVRGQVLHVQAVPGQTIGQEPLLTMADVSRMAVRAEVYEGDLERLRQALRQGSVTAVIQASALPRPLRGTISEETALARLIASNRVLPLDPRAARDTRVAEVLITLDDGDAPLAGLYVGLQVSVLFDLSGTPLAGKNHLDSAADDR
ncbi:MAG: HlyD family efflux transporter periplasmic adaptor subunit [Gemmataceae bacterium]|nr:HlyD family efflux transporter periplasmic adaptor subunit [Gemmataceae bacterium]